MAKSKGSIKLSPKHGVNPAIPVCFFCGKPKNEIVLLGKINREDSEAPKNCIMDYEPCDECKKLFAQGVALIEVTQNQPKDKRPPIRKDGDTPFYPTGNTLIIEEEAANRIFSNQHFHMGSICLVEEGIIEALQRNAKENEEKSHE